ncbi:cytospin-A isoform X2 [Anabrus simplex]|uniref:cytospin-A isoform X2 n=1 Tax=Anabrus simplex TaxID=316456 RepID=UPI0035A333AF
MRRCCACAEGTAMSTPARKRPLSSPTEPVAKNRSVRVRAQSQLPESLVPPSPRTTTPVSVRKSSRVRAQSQLPESLVPPSPRTTTLVGVRKTPAREAVLPNVTRRTPRNSSRPPPGRSRPQNKPTTSAPTSVTRRPVVPVFNTKPPTKEPIRRSPRHAGPGASGGGAGVKGGSGAGEGLKAAGSVSSLDSKLHKVPAGAVGPPPPSMEAVQAQLEQVSKEKTALEARVKELEVLQAEATQQQEQLVAENGSLRARLHDVTHSPLSDSEKEQLLLGAHHSAPASMMATEQVCQGESETCCPTPDWDKQSNSSISEVSVACLQDRILQMEETHYSTNEELQATLQELTDLQAQLTELQAENERLAEDKRMLLESLCRQTERLEDSCTRVDALQELLLRDGSEGEANINTEREQKLVDLLKSAQEKRDGLLLKQEELTTQVSDLRQGLDSSEQEVVRLTDRVRLLESTVDATHAERKQVEEELDKAREESSSRSIEISRLSKLLDNARSRIEELEQAREMADKSELDEMLDTARREKDALESQVASLQEQLSRSQCECTRLREQLQQLQEECKVIRNNSKCALSDLEYQRDSLRQEKQQLATDLQVIQESAAEFQVQCQYHLEDKRQLKAVLSETQRRLAELERKFSEQEKSLERERQLRKEENDEWEKFQSDLLMTVRVANDFKTEAQEEQQKLVLENKSLRDRVRLLEGQLEKLKAQKPPSPSLRPASTQFPTTTESSVEIAVRCHKAGVSRQDSHLSVKSLIESIENATKQAKPGPRSRSSSTSSLGSTVGEVPPTPTCPRRTDGVSDALLPPPKTPLRDQQQNNNQTAGNDNLTMGKNSVLNNRKALLTDNSYNKPGGGMKTPEENTVSILANKTMDFVRRNSYGDLSERKDPLASLVRNGGSKRNALLKWCQHKTVGYRNIDITNFSSSWNDGLALCAILHSYLPDRIPYDTLTPNEKRRNFTIAFAAAESVGIPTTLNLGDMIQLERPDWNQVMAYVTAIYKHFET